MKPPLMPITIGLLLAVGAGPLSAQAPAQPSPLPEEPRLIFERETFTYPTGGRRDPFRALTHRDELGPIFEELRLSMIIYDEVANQSLVVLADTQNRRYRLRRGETIGNTTVLNIGPSRVVFSVDNLGVRRQEVLELKRTRPEGA
jgi:hypothetical protein